MKDRVLPPRGVFKEAVSGVTCLIAYTYLEPLSLVC